MMLPPTYETGTRNRPQHPSRELPCSEGGARLCRCEHISPPTRQTRSREGQPRALVGYRSLQATAHADLGAVQTCPRATKLLPPPPPPRTADRALLLAVMR